MFGHSIISISIFTALLLHLGSFYTLVESYVLPEPTIEILKPQGIRVSIPDEPGLQFFAFQGNANKEIAKDQLGDISGEVYKKKDGKWTIQNQDVYLRDGDVIHYWIHAQVDGKTYKKNKTWSITSNKQQASSTNETTTSAGKLVLDENFNHLNTSLWSRIIQIPLSPDYEFCVYHNENHPSLVKIANGMLRIKPIILEDNYGENVTAYGTLILSDCTSNIPVECSRKAMAYNILPPIISARLNTLNSFSFRYGKIEIRAKFPEGDWLYPEMWLQPKYNNYGFGYSSGRVILGLARGNDNLVNITNRSVFDSRRLDFGFRIQPSAKVEDYIISKILENGPGWTKTFHVYTTIWNSDGFQFLVDGEKVGKLNPDTNGWFGMKNLDKMAPFDQEFYITIGLGVGGVRVFPDQTTSSGYNKPWRNVGAKAMLQFWYKKDQWLPTWKRGQGETTTFVVDYIRVWSF
ncbi:Beta-1,3-glucan-binding protein [Habropoda laboriosa]|uniref:Beta-1,3-glucan-binding protein n=1 Tax=Habropoda laboriosa TaxID=597456 RepID=A0A0L7QLH5_9HYME|nr:PREDICTED: beta-1,3-glucan-binding protein-like [Habropoda laboriosa]KOC59371.1 Beta-1,3-glucan-binding protein [Habropoda laboriosa]